MLTVMCIFTTLMINFIFYTSICLYVCEAVQTYVRLFLPLTTFWDRGPQYTIFVRSLLNTLDILLL